MQVDEAWLRGSFPELAIDRPLAAGGQKAVFRARDSDDRDVVLKLYHPSTNMQRALREAETGRRITSDYVPDVYDLGTTASNVGDVIWLVEAFVPGTGLRHLIAAGEIPAPDILRWTRSLLTILSEAEQLNIVHRDIKPENIMIDEDGEVWLLDFGLARHLDLESITATEATRGVGTAGYAPPEQFMNLKGQIDSRSDLFGLGVTTFECVEGVNPFREGAANQNEIYRRVATQQLPRINRQLDDRGEAGDLILALTRRQQEHRPRTVGEALDWAQEICEAEGL